MPYAKSGDKWLTTSKRPRAKGWLHGPQGNLKLSTNSAPSGSVLRRRRHFTCDAQVALDLDSLILGMRQQMNVDLVGTYDRGGAPDLSEIDGLGLILDAAYVHHLGVPSDMTAHQHDVARR